MLRIEERSDFDALEPAWRVLLASDPSATPFQSFEWISTWLCHFGRGLQPVTLLIYDGDDLVGGFAMSISHGPWRTLRALGTGHSDYLQPVVRVGYETRVAESITGWLCESTRFDLIDLHQLRETQPLAAGLDEQARCLVLDLPATYDDYLATLGKSLRTDVRRGERNAATEVELATSMNLDSTLDVFFETHRERWRKRGLPGAFGRRAEQFHREWAARALDGDLLRMSLLRLDGNPVGALYAMKQGAATYFYQAGFLPGAKAISPGTILVADAIRRAIDEGCTRFDFLRGPEPYKLRWKPQHEFKNTRMLVGKPNARAMLGMAWTRRAWQVENKLRERFEGRGLLG